MPTWSSVCGAFALAAEPDPTGHQEIRGASAVPASSEQAAAEESAPADPRDALALDPDKFELLDSFGEGNDHYIQRLDDGRIVHLTLEPKLQKAAGDYLSRSGKKPPHGGVVAIEPTTGRVLALIGDSPKSPQ